MNLYLPDYVRACIDALEDAGFEAWAVGGCVRDACLGRQPNDYDICTDALPDQTREVFRDWPMFLAGLKHGTVSVVSQKNVIEITTFRTEGEYLDSRHPQWVAFVPDVREDLARRDFTVNAMAWSPKRGFRDPFGGLDDLKNHVLRAVGDPALRFRVYACDPAQKRGEALPFRQSLCVGAVSLACGHGAELCAVGSDRLLNQ